MEALQPLSPGTRSAPLRLAFGAAEQAARLPCDAAAPSGTGEHTPRPLLLRGQAKSLSPTKAIREKKKRPTQLADLQPRLEAELPDRFVAHIERWGGGAKARAEADTSAGRLAGAALVSAAPVCAFDKLHGQEEGSPFPCWGGPVLPAQALREDASTSASSTPESFQIEGLDELLALGHLGQGASGRVEKHRHLKTGRELALKIIAARDIAEAQRKAIIIELKTFAKCRNAHIVNFYGAYFHDNCIHIALEYMDAGALSTILERTRTVPERLLASISWQVLDGFEYLHTQMHVIHRDVKPSNLLLSRSGIVKITDFGVSGELDDDVTSRCAVTFVGTMYYMSPERVRGEPYKYDSDLWSFGVTLLECLSGRYPYMNPDEEGCMKQLSFWELMRRIVEQDVPSLSPGSEHSQELRDFLQRMLQKEPCQRSSAAILKTHEWIVGPPSPAEQVKLASWVCDCVDACSDAATASGAATQAAFPSFQAVSPSRSRSGREAAYLFDSPKAFRVPSDAGASPATRSDSPTILDAASPARWEARFPVVADGTDSSTAGGMDQAIRGGSNPFFAPPAATPPSPASTSHPLSDGGCSSGGFAALAAAATAATPADAGLAFDDAEGLGMDTAVMRGGPNPFAAAFGRRPQ